MLIASALLLAILQTGGPPPDRPHTQPAMALLPGSLPSLRRNGSKSDHFSARHVDLSECLQRCWFVCTLSDRAPDFFTSPKRTTRVSEQADEPIVIDAVALAGIRFKAVAVDNRKLAVVITNQAGALELSSDIGNPSAPYA